MPPPDAATPPGEPGGANPINSSDATSKYSQSTSSKLRVGDLPSELAHRITEEPGSGCWEWAGAPSSKGYNRVRWQGATVGVHRLTYHLLVDGSLDLHPGRGSNTVDHLCRNRGCVNPAHLEPVSNRENTIRGETCLMGDFSSRFVGVVFSIRYVKPWRAAIHTAGRSVILGNYANESDAAYAYDAAAELLYGDATNHRLRLLEHKPTAIAVEVARARIERRPLIRETCEDCGAPLDNPRLRRRYCSQRCVSRAYVKRKREALGDVRKPNSVPIIASTEVPAVEHGPAGAMWQMSLFDTPVRPDPTVEHEAQWTPAILDAIVPLIPRGAWVHDCFAGTGHRLGQRADLHGWIFTGTEIVPEYIVDTRVRPGDATDPTTYPTSVHTLLTSPTYPNGMADHFKASDPTDRHTYRQALHRILGYDRPLHPNNMGRYNFRRGSKIAAEYWRLADAAVSCWTAPTVFVNIKDVVVDGQVVAVVEPWARLLERHGYDIVKEILIPCPGQRHGANGAARVDHEVVLVARLPHVGKS